MYYPTCTFVRDAEALLNTELQPFSTGSVRKIIKIYELSKQTNTGVLQNLNLTRIMDMNETPSLSNNIVPSRFRVSSRNIISVALVDLLKIGSSAL